MKHPLYPATAIILAGGKSSRLGFDKQLLQYNGTFLIDMLVTLLGSVFQEVILVSNTPELHQNRGCRIVTDILMESGPLGGLHSGLSAAAFPVCYLTACDMPWISVPYIRFLLESHREEPETEAVVTRLGEMLEPMNALYCKSLTPRIEALVAGGHRRMTALLDRTATKYVPEAIARRYSADWIMFDNINTPADWERFQNQAQGGPGDDPTRPNHAAYL